VSSAAEDLSGGEAEVVSDARVELELYRFLAELNQQLEHVRDAEKALRIALRLARDHFAANEACVALIHPGQEEAVPVYVLPKGNRWEGHLLASLSTEPPKRLPYNLLVAPIVRRERTWALLCLRREGGKFGRPAVRAVRRVAGAISESIQGIDRTRIADVRSRIDRKMMEQLRPQDLFYQILDGLRSLAKYDHSAAVLIHDEAPVSLELVAEKVWTRRTVASEPRLSELVEAYEQLGLEVRLGQLDPKNPEHLEEICSVCFEDPEFVKSAKVVYTAPRPQEELESLEEDLFSQGSTSPA
jgi:hypothetical protein